VSELYIHQNERCNDKKTNRNASYITFPDQFNVFLYLYSLCGFVIIFTALIKILFTNNPPFFVYGNIYKMLCSSSIKA